MTGERGERGSTTSEFLAVILVVASAIAVTAGVGSKEGAVVGSVQHGFCKVIVAATKALGVETKSTCGDGGSKKLPADLPPCIVYDRERLTGANGTFRFIHAEISGKDKITTVIDPATGKGGDAGGKLGVQAGGNLVYKFDSHEEAEEFLEQRRGNVFKRAAGAFTGPTDGLFDPLANELRGEYGRTIGGAAGYAVKFDKNGKPISFIYRTETQSGSKYKIGNKSNVSGDADTVTNHTYTLDLKDPENAAALQDAVTKYGWSPALFASLPYLDTPLADRLANHSVEYEQVYDANGNTIAGGTPEKSKEQGVKARGAGLAVNDDESSRTLRSARYIDHRQPGATWQKLAKCKAPSGGGS